MGDVVLQRRDEQVRSAAHRWQTFFAAGISYLHRIAAFAIEHFACAQIPLRHGGDIATKIMRLAGRLVAQRRRQDRDIQLEPIRYFSLYRRISSRASVFSPYCLGSPRRNRSALQHDVAPQRNLNLGRPSRSSEDTTSAMRPSPARRPHPRPHRMR